MTTHHSPSQAEVLAKLDSIFGFPSLRPLQQQAIDAILANRDTFVLMPTGGGKSLCYQLPALVRPGLTVVVSPLIALMKDQVDRLQSMGVAATFINSSLDPSEVGRRQGMVARGQVKLLYVAPERLMMGSMLSLLAAARASLFAIDEAHCISEWGHDFRPEYRELRRLRQFFPTASIAAFTATATKRVQADILAQLGLRNAVSVRGSLNRPNLYYQVWRKQQAYQRLVGYLRTRGKASGIIYVFSRNSADQLAERLRSDRFSGASYHAGLSPEERQQRQDAFIHGETSIVVATIAFGMGIDKPDVRFVLHYDLPRNLEGYYQESGRAGRDGAPADCILFYSYGDVARHAGFIDEKSSAAEREIAHAQLKQVVSWAESSACRRQGLLAYFDEEIQPQPSPCCDNCTHPAQEQDYTAEAYKLLSCIQQLREGFGIAYVIRMLLASRDQRILDNGHDRLSTYGTGKGRTRQEWHHIADELARRGYIELTPGAYSTVRLKPLGAEALAAKQQVRLAAPSQAVAGKSAGASRLPPARETGSPLSGVEGPSGGNQAGHGEPSRTTAGEGVVERSSTQLFEELRALRRTIAQARGVPPYVIFHDTVLQQMAAELPQTRAALAALRGVGEHKLNEFGDAFLEVLNRHSALAPAGSGAVPGLSLVGERPSGADAKEVPAGEGVVVTKPTLPKVISPQEALAAGLVLGASPKLTLEMFRQGLPVADIAEQRGLAIATVEGHLAQAVEAGEHLDINQFVSPQKQAAIRAAFAKMGDAQLTPVYTALGEGYSYGELRLVRAALRARQAQAP